LRPRSGDPAVLSLTSLAGTVSWRTEDDLAPLSIALWQDGTICWSENRSRGGAPYRTARLEAARVEELRSTICTKLGPEPARGRFYAVPDASVTEIAVQCGEGVLTLASCIDVFESGGHVIATDHGIEPLADRDRESVLARQSPALREFRALWRECVDRIWSAVPDTGERLPIDHFEYAWE
jgi:hypothetical protein